METRINDMSYGPLLWQIALFLTIGLTIYAFVDVLRNAFRKNNKLIWILVVLFIPVLGSILYLFIGRKQRLMLY
jgi:heme/copper-type cytochrome/quinol oxidase subunit 4